MKNNTIKRYASAYLYLLNFMEVIYLKSSRQKLQEYEEKYSEIPLDLEERLEYMVKKYNVSDSKMEKILMKKQLMLETLIFKHIRLVLMEVPEGTPRHRYRIVNKSNYHQMAKAMPQYVHVYSPGAKENNVRMKRLVGEELDELQALITTPCIITYRTFHKTPDAMPMEDKFLAEIGLELAKTIAVKKSVQDQINALNDLKEVNSELS